MGENREQLLMVMGFPFEVINILIQTVAQFRE